MSKSLFVLFGFTFLTFAVQAQNKAFKDQSITLHNYMFSLTDEFQMHLANQDPEDVMLDTGKDPVVERFMTESYQRIKSTMESKLGSTILPKETLEGKVLYDIYGYPAGHRKRAAQNGHTPYYLKLSVQISARDMVSETVGVNDASFEKQKIKPHVAIHATVYDQKSKKVFKAIGKAKGQEWVYLDQVSLFGFLSLEGQNIVDEQATLLRALDAAILDLKTQLP